MDSTNQINAMNTKRVVCFGEALIDLFPDEDTPKPKSMSKVRAFRPLLGGAPANAAVGFARLGLDACLLSIVGQDGFGDFICELLAKEGVNVEAVERTLARTGLAFVSWDDNFDRRFLFYRGTTADAEINEAYVHRSASCLKQCDGFHFCGSALSNSGVAKATELALTYAVSQLALVSFDLNLRPHLWKEPKDAGPAASGFLDKVDVVKADLEEAEIVTGFRDPKKAVDGLFELGPKFVALTMGADGAVWRTKNARGRVIPPRISVVDTTGAGDAFSAALIAGLLVDLGENTLDDISEEKAETIVRRACKAGSMVCTGIGATTNMARTLDLFPGSALANKSRH